MFLFGILQGNAKTNWIWIVIVGVVYFCSILFPVWIYDSQDGSEDTGKK